MENFQRYFLIACVFIMSYFLIIRWDPPSSKPIVQDVKSEVSTYSQKEDFGFIDESIKNEPEELITNSVSTTCASGGDYEIDSNNWKISVDLMDGSFKKADGLVVGSQLCQSITNSLKKGQNPVTKLNKVVYNLKNQIV